MDALEEYLHIQKKMINLYIEKNLSDKKVLRLTCIVKNKKVNKTHQ